MADPVTLEPCAHCGALNPKEEREVAEPLDWFYVQCADPECGARTQGWGLRSSARKAWNRRSSNEALVKALREWGAAREAIFATRDEDLAGLPAMFTRLGAAEVKLMTFARAVLQEERGDQ